MKGFPVADDLTMRIQDVLQELRRFSRFGGCYFDFTRTASPALQKDACRFCLGCLRHPRGGGLCQSHVQSAAVQGFAIGDAWYTRCWLGVDGVVIPVAPDNRLVGAIEIGGFFSVGEAQHAEQKILARLASLDGQGILEQFVSALQGMREVPFMEVQAAAEFVLEATFAKGLNQAEEFRLRKKIFAMQQQAGRIASGREANRRYADVMLGLLKALDGPDPERSRKGLDEFTALVLRMAEGDAAKFRGALLPLLSMQAQARIQRGEPWSLVFGQMESRFLELEKLDDVAKLCAWMEKRFRPEPAGGAAAARPAESATASLQLRLEPWIQARLQGKIRVAEAARAVGMSPSSLVHRLKQESGHTFSDLVKTERICEAKRLLAFTNQSLGEISRRCGFPDQSYFTKVFAGQTGLRPGEFRRMLIQQPES